MTRPPRLALAALPLLLSMAALGTAQPSFDFMPDGGKQTLAQLAQRGALKIGEVAQTRASEEEWRSILHGADAALDEKTAATLASYLAVNMPAKAAADTIEKLPPDGKELAIENCQFCHSFFTGYLVHDRDVEGWRAIFKSPFHMELPMSAAERETFARYSAINLPIAYENVPEDLRF